MQTSYATTRALGYAGLEVDTEPSLKKHAVNGESVAIPFGVVVCRHATDGKAKLPAAASDMLSVLGIALSTYWQDNRSLTGAEGVKAGEPFNIIEEGGVWVLCEQDVAAADLGKPVYARITTDGATNTQLGKIRKDVDSGRAVRVAGIVFDSAGAAGTPIKVRLRAALGGSEVLAPMVFDHAQATGDVTQTLFKNASDRFLKLKAVQYLNATGLAEDAANFFEIKVSDGTTVHASWSTKKDKEGTIAAATFVSLTLGAAPYIAPGATVSLILDETETATLPAGSLFVHGEYI